MEDRRKMLTNWLKRHQSSIGYSRPNEDVPPEKRPRLYPTTLEDLPDELQLKIFSHLCIKDLVRCVQVSKRTRRICLDESIWEKINLCKKNVHADLLRFILDNGCKYLDLGCSKIKGDLKLSGKNYEVKYLNLAECTANIDVFRELITSCQSLQKLSLRGLESNTNPGMKINVIPILLNNLNHQFLKVLDIQKLDGLNLRYVKNILKSEKLTEISFRYTPNLSRLPYLVDYIVHNLPENIQKISLGGISIPGSLKDAHIKARLYK